jgi:hypothetical protein
LYLLSGSNPAPPVWDTVSVATDDDGAQAQATVWSFARMGDLVKSICSTLHRRLREHWLRSELLPCGTLLPLRGIPALPTVPTPNRQQGLPRVAPFMALRAQRPQYRPCRVKGGTDVSWCQRGVSAPIFITVGGGVSGVSAGLSAGVGGMAAVLVLRCRRGVSACSRISIRVARAESCS